MKNILNSFTLITFSYENLHFVGRVGYKDSGACLQEAQAPDDFLRNDDWRSWPCLQDENFTRSPQFVESVKVMASEKGGTLAPLELVE